MHLTCLFLLWEQCTYSSEKAHTAAWQQVELTQKSTSVYNKDLSVTGISLKPIYHAEYPAFLFYTTAVHRTNNYQLITWNLSSLHWCSSCTKQTIFFYPYTMESSACSSETSLSYHCPSCFNDKNQLNAKKKKDYMTGVADTVVCLT